MEGNPLERTKPGIKKEHIPGLPPLDSYAEKTARMRELEAEIKADRKIVDTLRVTPGGINAPTAQKILNDTIARLAENEKEYKKLMGISVQ